MPHHFGSWTIFGRVQGAIDAPKGTPKKFRASWINSYQKPRAAGLEHLDKVSSGDREQIRARTMHPPIVLPSAAGSIVNFDRCVKGIV